jgi:Carbohydrate binding domain
MKAFSNPRWGTERGQPCSRVVRPRFELADKAVRAPLLRVLRPPAFSSFRMNCALLVLLLGVSLLQPGQVAAAESPKNLFANPSFELGRGGWQLDKAGKTEARFSLDEKDAACGQNCAALSIGMVEQWGVQFGQHMSAGQKGKTYTFAAFGQSTKEPVEMGLQIERSASPWDRAASGKFILTTNWKEFHVSFTVEKDFSPGWFAYVSCTQTNVQFRVDMFRLYEGSYVPYQEIAQQEAVVAGVRVFDSGTPSPGPLSPALLAKRDGWTEILEDELSHKFKGDAVVLNNSIALLLRHGARGAEVYSLGPDAPSMRAVLTPTVGTNSSTLSGFKLVENTAGAAAADVAFTAADGRAIALRYTLKFGQPVVLTENRNGATGLRVDAPCRFALMPDFFADDIVVDAAELTAAETDLPSDNLVLHLLPDRQAMVMAVVKTAEEDVHIDLSGEGDERMIRSSSIRYGKDGKIWVAVLAGREIWHRQDITREQAAEVIRLDWTAPFQAQWRTDWRREEGLMDSWDMLNQRPDGGFVKYGVFGAPDLIPPDRKRWTTVLGNFSYPCWLDKDGRGWLQPLKSSALHFQGPAIIYPLNRVPATGLDDLTVVDIVRNTLGVGPCEYILDVEGQQSQYKGRATCAVRDALNPIYSQNQQKQRREEIERILQDVVIFIRHIRGRITGYVDFSHETLAYLEQQALAHPDLAGPLAELEKTARVIDAKLAARKNEIKTPEDAAAMVEEFRKSVLDYEGDDALAKCKEFTEAWVKIGGNQDELAGECRWVVKMLRQKAGLLTAADPRMADVAKEIRRRTQVVLRNPAIHEGARH